MTLYHFKVRTADGRIEQGVAAGETAAALRGELRDRRCRILSMHPVARPPESAPKWLGWRLRPGRLFPFRWQGLGRRAGEDIAGELGSLLSVGISLSAGLDVLAHQFRGHRRRLVLSLQEALSAGQPLSAAMRQFPECFDACAVGLVEVGEQTGGLDSSLGKIASLRRRTRRTCGRIFNALLYPLFVLVLSLAVTAFLMTYVVPVLLDNLQQMGRQLPWPTEVLRWVSSALTRYGWLIVMALGVALPAAWAGGRTRAGAWGLSRIALRTPLLGSVLLKHHLSRIAFVMSALLSSGVEFLVALEMSGRSTTNLEIRAALDRCRRQVIAGNDIADGLAGTRVFPASVVHVFSMGQHTGQLDSLLAQLADDLDQQVQVATERLTATLEPMLIVLLAMGVGFILFATMLPILEAGNVT